jgi:hypothetical protein
MSIHGLRARSTTPSSGSVRLEDRGLGPVRPLRVVLVAGAGRSGSTLLTLLLGSLPGTFAAGELRYLWQRGLVEHRLCGCGKPLPDCALWRTILHQTFDGDVPANIDDAIDAVNWIGNATNLPVMLRRPSSIPPIGDLPVLLSRLYRAVAETTGAHTIIDSSKPPTYGWLVGTLPGVELSVIHLVRDPRGTAFSWLNPKAAVDRPKGGLMPRKPAWKSALNWGVWNMATELLFRGRPDRLLRVRYEDLVAEPEATLASVLAFLGYAEVSLDALEGRSFHRCTSHTVAGNPLRLGNEPTVLRPNAVWEAELPTASRRVVTALAAPLLHRYGYRIRSSP